MQFKMTQAETSGMGRTTVSLDEETADELHAMKQRGDSYDDVVQRLIEHYAEADDDA